MNIDRIGYLLSCGETEVGNLASSVCHCGLILMRLEATPARLMTPSSNVSRFTNVAAVIDSSNCWTTCQLKVSRFLKWSVIAWQTCRLVFTDCLHSFPAQSRVASLSICLQNFPFVESPIFQCWLRAHHKPCLQTKSCRLSFHLFSLFFACIQLLCLTRGSYPSLKSQTCQNG